jgi:hypothetical protein
MTDDLILHKGLTPSEPDARDYQIGEMIEKAAEDAALTSLPLPHEPFGHANTYDEHSPAAQPTHHWQGNGNMPQLANEIETVPSDWEGRRGMGNCVLASMLNELKVMLTDGGVGAATALKKIGAIRKALEAYRDVTGADPISGAGDNGTDIRQRLLWQKSTGYTDKASVNHRLGIFGRFSPSDFKTLTFCIYNFDAVVLSCEVTQENERAFTSDWQSGQRPTWDESGEREGQDNHCVCAVGRPNKHAFTIISWDRPIDLTEAFLVNQCHEAWAYSSPDRINKVTGESYRGATPAALDAYIRASLAAH